LTGAPEHAVSAHVVGARSETRASPGEFTGVVGGA